MSLVSLLGQRGLLRTLNTNSNSFTNYLAKNLNIFVILNERIKQTVIRKLLEKTTILSREFRISKLKIWGMWLQNKI